VGIRPEDLNTRCLAMAPSLHNRKRGVTKSRIIVAQSRQPLISCRGRGCDEMGPTISSLENYLYAFTILPNSHSKSLFEKLSLEHLHLNSEGNGARCEVDLMRHACLAFILESFLIHPSFQSSGPVPWPIPCLSSVHLPA